MHLACQCDVAARVDVRMRSVARMTRGNVGELVARRCRRMSIASRRDCRLLQRMLVALYKACTEWPAAIAQRIEPQALHQDRRRADHRQKVLGVIPTSESRFGVAARCRPAPSVAMATVVAGSAIVAGGRWRTVSLTWRPRRPRLAVATSASAVRQRIRDVAARSRRASRSRRG